MQIVRNIRYNTNDEYKEKIDIELKDERNKYIRMKAWSWAGYIFIIIASVACFALYIAGYKMYGQIVSYCICAVLVIYWFSYLLLQRKY